MDCLHSHSRFGLSEGRGHRAGLDSEESRDLTAIEAEVELRDNDSPLPLGQRPQQLVDLDAIQDGVEFVSVTHLRSLHLRRNGAAIAMVGASCMADGYAEEPPGEILVVGRWLA
jgi:hypothetical protein